MALALSATISGAGCANLNKQLAEAGKAKGEASVVDDALALSQRRPDLPEYPDYCRDMERSGVMRGERLDAALLKTDAALARANARPARCAAWYEEIRKAHGGGR